MRQEHVRVEWYYDYGFYAPEDDKVLLALLQVFSDGRASVLTEDGKTYLTFENETDAHIWLTDEELHPLEILFENAGINAFLDGLHLTLPK